MFLLFSGYLVFVMQAGFAMLCAGHIRPQSNMNILLKNLVDCAAGTVAWYLLGNGFAFGEINGYANPFIGAGDFALSNTYGSTRSESSYYKFFFHWAFSAAAATIVAGAVAERISLGCYFFYSSIMSAFAYPVVVHWLWTEWGWLSPFNARPLFGSGAIDFAGGIVVHMVGGTVAFIGAWFIGPRLGRFDMEGEPTKKGFRDNNGNLVVLGTFLLWFGWYGFNPGSAAAISNDISAAVVSRVAVASTIAAGTGGITALFFTFFVTRKYDVMQVCNGVLCGLVAVTPCCGVIDMWAAVLVAMMGVGVFMAADSFMLNRLKMDDVVAAAPMHLGCGAVGSVFLAFFARKEFVMDYYGPLRDGVGRRWGVFFGGDGTLLACQLIAMISTVAWVCIIFVPYFWLMHRFDMLRVPHEQELAGLDASKHGVLTTNELPSFPQPPRKRSQI